MPANRTLGKSLAYRAFRAARAEFARVINDEKDEDDIASATHVMKMKLDELGIKSGHPLRSQLISAVVQSIRPSAMATLEDQEDRSLHEEVCREQFGPRDDTPSLDQPWWEHR
jgi:hypothetical protein